MDKKERFIPPKNKNDLSGMLSGLIKQKRVAVFIDSANLYYATNKASIKIDYFQIQRWFVRHCTLASLNFYTAYDPLDDRQQDFFVDLENSGYRLIKKPIKVFADSVKGNMDIELAVDALIQQSEYEVLVLISGDGDFRYLVKALEAMGKQTIILGVGGFTSYELHQEADNYFFLNRITEVWQKSYRPRSTIPPNTTNPTQNLPTLSDDKIIHIEGQTSERTKLPKVRVKLHPKPKIIIQD